MLIGSRALAVWNPKFILKPNADWDIVGPNHYGITGKVEEHKLDHLNNEEIPRYFDSGETLDGVPVCSLMGLALIKRSHLWRELDFDKHITHYHVFIKPVLSDWCIFPSWEQNQWYNERVKLTLEAYPQRGPNLDKSNEDFFDDAVEKVYEHDYIHELFAYHDRPLYTYLKYDSKVDKAWCERDLWKNLQNIDKHRCVAEETYVIATERFLIPSGWEVPTKLAYMKALKKVCTTLCKGWFRDWAIDNYPAVMNLYDDNKFQEVKGKLK